MSFKAPKHAFQIVLGTLFLTFAVAACNNKADEKKESAMDSAAKMAPKMDSTKMADSVKQKPTETGN